MRSSSRDRYFQCLSFCRLENSVYPASQSSTWTVRFPALSPFAAPQYSPRNTTAARASSHISNLPRYFLEQTLDSLILHPESQQTLGFCWDRLLGFAGTGSWVSFSLLGFVELVAMGMWDEYCTICGGPTYVLFDDMEDEEGKPFNPPNPPNPADYTWLESFVGISSTEELIPLHEYNFYGSFDIQSDTSPYNLFFIGCRSDEYVTEKDSKGYACHVTCYNLLQRELNYTLKFADVQPLLVDNEYCDLNRFSWSDYGGLAEYQDQGFGCVQLVQDGKLWMIEDPSQNEKNKERILQVWRPLLESGFKRPDARVGEGSTLPEIAELKIDDASAQ